LGYTPSTFDPDKVRLAFESPRGYIEVCANGAGVPFSEEKAKLVLGAQEITILVDLGGGEGQATAWGCDLSYEYVRINGDYRT
jgi:glutamate N-acetyltransferase / amino-acid N-acetyltransferase